VGPDLPGGPHPGLIRIVCHKHHYRNQHMDEPVYQLRVHQTVETPHGRAIIQGRMVDSEGRTRILVSHDQQTRTCRMKSCGRTRAGSGCYGPTRWRRSNRSNQHRVQAALLSLDGPPRRRRPAPAGIIGRVPHPALSREMERERVANFNTEMRGDARSSGCPPPLCEGSSPSSPSQLTGRQSGNGVCLL